MAQVAFLLALLIATAVSNLVAPVLAYAMGWQDYLVAAYIALFVAGYLAANTALLSLFSVVQLAGGGLWTFSLSRLFVGWVGWIVRLVVVVWVANAFAGWAAWPHTTPQPLGAWSHVLWIIQHPVYAFKPFALPDVADVADARERTRFAWQFVAWNGVLLLGLVLLFLHGMRLSKRVIAYLARPMELLWQAIKTGVGGSSSFNGIMADWRMPWSPGKIILGASMYEPKQRVGVRDDRHMITIANSRSGKGVSCIIPNLLTWPGPVLVIDPKGENAAVTAIARARDLKQTVRIVDPFEVLRRPDLKLRAEDYPTHRYNPLDEIDLDDIQVVEHIRNLGASLVMPSPNANPFWDDASRKILGGIIAHVLTWDQLKPEDRHLGTVRDYVAEVNGRLLTDLVLNKSAQAGNLHQIAASELKRASETAGGDIMTTLGVHMEWMDSVAMRRAFEASDFRMDELKTTDTSLYLVIPVDLLDTHARYLRLFVTQALRAAGRTKKSKHPMLFVLDEFAALGKLSVVESAAGTMAGFGVKLWPIVQNITQLQALYEQNWETFLSNAGVQQVFAMNDQTTARYFSEKLGQHISWRKIKTQRMDNEGRPIQEQEWVPQGSTFLRTPVEMARASSRDSWRLLTFFEGGNVSLLKRTPYFSTFKPSQYSPNPYQPVSGWQKWRPAMISHRFKLWADGMDKRWQAWLYAAPLPLFERLEAWELQQRQTPPDRQSWLARLLSIPYVPAAASPEPVPAAGVEAAEVEPAPPTAPEELPAFDLDAAGQAMEAATVAPMEPELVADTVAMAEPTKPKRRGRPPGTSKPKTPRAKRASQGGQGNG